MSSFNLPLNSAVLLTVPVLIYATFARKPNGTYPLSHECNTLVERCRTRYHHGIITTNTIARCWTVMQKLATRVHEPEADTSETIEPMVQVNRIQPQIPKRMAALLCGDLRIVTVEVSDFEAAAVLIRDFRLPATIAVELAAVKRDCKFNSLPVALPGKPKWKANEVGRPCWCSDLPWQMHPKSVSRLQSDQDQGSLKI